MTMAEEGEKKKKKFSVLLCGQELERIEQMSIDGSHYSLSNEVLPSLGARSNRRVKLRGFIVSPYDHRYRTWETFLVLLVLYTAWVSPFELGFLDIPDRALAITDNVVNAFFFVDIVLTFFVAYLDKNTYLLVDDHKDIAKRYASTWLVFDVISTIPTELAMKVLPQSLQTAGLFNMLRLWRVRRISALFARLEKDRNFNYFWVRVVKLIVVILFYVHCASCFYNFLTNQYPDPSKTWIATYMPDYATASVWPVYITTFYFAITTVTTTGYGDLHPVNSWEMIFDIFFMLLNLGLNAYLIGNMTNLIVHGTNRTRKFRDTIQAASSFAHRNQLPVRLQDQMLAHLCLKFRIDSEGLQQQETFDSLPKAIRSSISHFLFYSLVDKAYLFRGVSSDLLFQLVSEMKAEYFPPKEDVILQNEAPTDFYILVNGTVDLVLLKNGVEQIVGELRTGDLCGEIGVLCYRPQLFTVRTKRLSQLLRLNRTSFLNIIQANVGDGNIIMNNLLQHMKELNDLTMDGVLLETENMLARGRMDLPLSLCFAAIRGDDLLLHQLLRRGLDPNEADHGKRTPMHIAACNGNESCVMLLLDYGADPNRRDAEGNVSLWEAIVGGHEKVKKLLVNNGATLVSGDIGRFACTAAEQNNLELLKEAVHYGVDVRQPESDGTTALHAAVNEGNIDVVKFLLDQGANIDHADIHGWTPRSLADQQAHEEIKALFFARQESGHQASIAIPDVKSKPLEKFKSEPSMRSVTQDGTTTPSRKEADLSGFQRRCMTKNFENSLFGIMSAANTGERPSLASMSSITGQTYGGYSARVIISCPEKSGSTKKLVVLPPSLQELLELGSRKFDIVATKVVMEEDKAEVDDIVLIRDGDHLVLLADSGATPSSSGVGVRFSLS